MEPSLMQRCHVLRHVPGPRDEPDPVAGLFAAAVPREGEAGGGVHGLQEAAEGHAAEDHRVLRAPLPGQVLRRGGDPRGALGEAQGGECSDTFPESYIVNDIFNENLELVMFKLY